MASSRSLTKSKSKYTSFSQVCNDNYFLTKISYKNHAHNTHVGKNSHLPQLFSINRTKNKPLPKYRTLNGTLNQYEYLVFGNYGKNTYFCGISTISLVLQMDKTSFTPYQQKVIDLMARVNSDEQMSEINDILSKYFAQKAISMTDKLWEEGTITENTIEAWKNEHLRTPYNSY